MRLFRGLMGGRGPRGGQLLRNAEGLEGLNIKGISKMETVLKARGDFRVGGIGGLMGNSVGGANFYIEQIIGQT